VSSFCLRFRFNRDFPSRQELLQMVRRQIRNATGTGTTLPNHRMSTGRSWSLAEKNKTSLSKEGWKLGKIAADRNQKTVLNSTQADLRTAREGIHKVPFSSNTPLCARNAPAIEREEPPGTSGGRIHFQIIWLAFLGFTGGGGNSANRPTRIRLGVGVVVIRATGPHMITQPTRRQSLKNLNRDPRWEEDNVHGEKGPR